jgi:pimeloyl-ACP methyl ester carboxylesterase
MSDLLLLHGLTYDHRAWGPLIDHLSPGRRVVAVDLPGHGSAPRWDAYPLSGIAGYLGELGLESPVVVGHSAGAIVAGAYAARFPTTAVVNIDQMLLPGPFFAAVRAASPQLHGPGWRLFWERMLAGMGIESLPAAARELVETATDPRPDLLLGYWDEILRDSDAEIQAAREKELRAITGPYHWVTSSEPPAEYVSWLRSVLPQAAYTVVPGGHFPHIAAPEVVARIIAEL